MENYCSMVVVLLVVALSAYTESYPNQRERYGSDEPSYSRMPYGDRRYLEENNDDYNAPADTASGFANNGQANFNPFAIGPLSGFMQSMQDMMKRVQMQMGEVLSRMPPQDIDWGKLGNTTSHTKMVNNHLVTVNETTYHNEDKNSTAVFHIRIVDVRPTGNNEAANTELPLSTYSTNTHNTDGEQTSNVRRNPYRSFTDNSRKFKRQDPRTYANLNPRFLDTVDNAVDVFKPMNPIDLSRDTLVNNLMRSQSKSGLVMIDPDAELIDVHDGKVQEYRPSERFHNQQRKEPVFT